MPRLQRVKLRYSQDMGTSELMKPCRLCQQSIFTIYDAGRHKQSGLCAYCWVKCGNTHGKEIIGPEDERNGCAECNEPVWADYLCPSCRHGIL